MACETSTQQRATLPAARRFSFLLLAGTASQFVGQLPQLFVQGDDVGQLLFDFVAALGVGRALDFEVA